MAKPITDTPALEGKEAYDFLKRMTKSATKDVKSSDSHSNLDKSLVTVSFSKI